MDKHISENRNNTAYCGLYCKDCIPSNKHLFELLGDLDDLLTEIKFDNYAELKAGYDETFNDYDTFITMLKTIRKLECKDSCFHGPFSQLGCHNNCEVRQCVINKKLEGCWECSDNTNCNHLERLRKHHPHFDEHLELIKRYGIEKWIDKRKKHYNWG